MKAIMKSKTVRVQFGEKVVRMRRGSFAGSINSVAYYYASYHGFLYQICCLPGDDVLCVSKRFTPIPC